ncbi:hypothetical protein HKX48_000096 [Thoreauomyces humboldtii]|nr:hypothetical protein HKX48_000096 [Thoreauomyces humboldtii]
MIRGDIQNGNVGVGATEGILGPSVITKLTKRKCKMQTMEEQELDFDETWGELERISGRMAVLERTVGVQRGDDGAGTTLLLNLRGDEPTQVLNLDVTQLSGSSLIAIPTSGQQITPGTTLLINVLGDLADSSVLLAGTDTSALTFPGKVIWNFPDARKIRMGDLDWYGTVIAPRARIEGSNARILGSLYALSFSGDAHVLPPAFDGPTTFHSAPQSCASFTTALQIRFASLQSRFLQFETLQKLAPAAAKFLVRDPICLRRAVSVFVVATVIENLLGEALKRLCLGKERLNGSHAVAALTEHEVERRVEGASLLFTVKPLPGSLGT